jgi:APA family basic amino acid/polyamine antiporter
LSAAGDGALRREIGTAGLAANVVNIIIGSGIFALPGAVAALLGPAALVAYVACAIVVGLIGLCFAECGSRVAESGGPSAYIEAAFGPYAGALAMSMSYLSFVVASAAVAHVFLDSLTPLVPALAGGPARVAACVLLYGGFAAANLRGVRSGTRLVTVLTVVKLAPLVLLAAAGIAFGRAENFTGFAWPDGATLAQATLLLVFAFVGVEGAIVPSGEVREPARTVPRAIGLGLLAVAALYGGLQVAAQGVLGPALAKETTAPLAALATALVGTPGGVLVLAAASISTFAYLASDALCAPRLLYAMGREGLLPPALGRVSASTAVPRAAIVAHAALAGSLALFAGLGPLMLVTSVSVLLLYFGSALATPMLRRKNVRLETPPFVLPGGLAIPAAAAVSSGWLLLQASWPEFAACGVAALIVSAYFFARRRTAGRAASAA